MLAMQSRVRQRSSNRFLTQLFCGANPMMVGLSPGFHHQIFFLGKREESSVYAHMTMQTPQHLRVFDLIAPVFLQRRQQHLLGVVMLGKCARRAHNSHVFLVSEALSEDRRLFSPLGIRRLYPDQNILDAVRNVRVCHLYVTSERQGSSVKFIVGLVLGLVLVPFGAYLYFTGGSAPVAATDSEMPFEHFFAKRALHVRVAKDMPKNVPIQPNEANYVAGAERYKQHWEDLQRYSPERHARIQQIAFRNSDVANGDPVSQCRQAAALGKSDAGRAHRSKRAGGKRATDESASDANVGAAVKIDRLKAQVAPR